MDAIELLEKACKETSQGKVASSLGVSKASVNRLLKGNYPNPQKMNEKILNVYGNGVEIIGVETKKDLKDFAKEWGCI